MALKMMRPAAISPKVSAMTAPDLDHPRQTVGSIVQAIAVLRHLGDVGRGLGVSAIAKALSISPSSCFNILRTLVAEGMLDFDPADKSYTLAVGVIELAHRALSQSEMYAFARHQLERLADAFQMTVALRQVSRSDRLVVLAVAECDADMQVRIRVGHRVPLLAGAGGRCVAAFGKLSREEIEQRFGELQWHRPRSFESYYKSLEGIRRKGWAVDQGEYRAGATTVAAPIFDDLGAMSFCITGTMFTGQHDAETLEKIGQDISRTAQAVSQRRAHEIARFKAGKKPRG